MSLLAFPSILALVIKLWLFRVSGKALFVSNPFLAYFLCSLFALNLVELTFFLQLIPPDNALPILISYYIAAIYSAAAYLAIAINLVRPSRLTQVSVFLMATLMAVLMCIPDLVIAGVTYISYSITKIPGEYYWLLQIYLVGILIIGTAILLYGLFYHQNSLTRKRCLAILISTVPMTIAVISVVGLMALGYPINGAVILSLVTTLTLIILIYTESRYRLFLFLSYVPYTIENDIRKHIAILVRQSVEALFKQGGTLDMKSISAKFESALIEMAIEATNGNKTHAAEILQIGKATLHRKLSRP